MNSFCSTTQSDDDVFTHWADPLWTAGEHYTSAQQGIHHNFNAANDLALSPAPITPTGTFTTLLTQGNYMYPDVPDPCSILPEPSFDASTISYQPVGDPDWTFATDSVAATFSEGMSPNDSLISPTSMDDSEWALFSEPGQSTCTTPSSSYGSGAEVGCVATKFGVNIMGNSASLAECTSELWPILARTSTPAVDLGKRRREAEEPHDDGGPMGIDIQIPPKKRARGGGASNGIPKAAQSAKTRHKPGARFPEQVYECKPKEAGRGAGRLATPKTQGIYNQSLLRPLLQGWAVEAADGSMTWFVGSVDEEDSAMKQQQQQEEEEVFVDTDKLTPMQKALLDATKTASGVDIKCLLCPETHLKSLQDFKRHCNTAEAHPLEISFCDACGDFFARKDSLRRHQKNRPPECNLKSPTEEEAGEKRKEAEKKRRATQIAHEDFLRGLEERLKTGNLEDFVPFSQIIKGKYPKSSKKRRIGSSKIVESAQGTMQ